MGFLDPKPLTPGQADAKYADIPTLQSVSTTVAQVGESRRSHGGKIGTSGKGVIAFRIDHYIDAYRATVWPLMKARGFVAGLGIISRPDNPVDPTTSTWAQVKQLVNEGNEVWSHTATHTDPGNDPARVIEEVVTSKQELEAQGFKVHGFQMAGTATTNPNFGSNFNSMEDFNSPVGRLLLSNYGLIECYAGGSRRLLPTDGCYGLDHVTIESLTLTQIKAVVDEVTRYGYGVELMIHANRIGAAGYLSLTDFTALLDYIKAAWDAGTLEVLSPSGLAWADPASDYKTELLTDTSFEGVSAPSSAGPVWFMQGGSGVTVGTDGGRTGSKYARFTPASGFAYMLQSNTKVQQLGLQGTAMIVEGWARAPLGAANARMFVVDNNDNTRINLDVNWALAAGQGWTRFRIPFVCPVGTTNLAIKVSRFSGDTIDWDDVRAYVV